MDPKNYANDLEYFYNYMTFLRRPLDQIVGYFDGNHTQQFIINAEKPFTPILNVGIFGVYIDCTTYGIVILSFTWQDVDFLLFDFSGFF